MAERNQRRVYGSGSLWLRKSKKHPDGVFWIRFHDVAGKLRAENSSTDSETKALRLLAKRIGESQAGTLPSQQSGRTLMDDLAESYFKIYKAELQSRIGENLPDKTRAWREERAEQVLSEAKARWDNHLKPVFGDRKASLITTEDLHEYLTKRRKAKARNATVNREMALLLRMFRVGYNTRPRKVSEVPIFPKKLPEEARKGHVDATGFENVLKAISQPGLRAMLLVAYRLGFRKAELQNLLVIQIQDGWIKLFAGATKNGRERSVPMPADVKEAVEACIAGKKFDDYVFTWASGKPIRDYRTAWKNACTAAKVPKLSVHDLRRSAVRNMVRKGISPIVGMQITGHLTREVFDDYDVTATGDLLEAAKVL
jgi:integrase